MKAFRVCSALRRGAACLTLACFAATAEAPADVRVALVIGNSAYPGTAALVNPANDAQAMTATLRRLGFTVTEVRDASRDQMAQAVAAVGESLRGKQGVGMLYYAGHGVQLDWRNYMVPVDARIKSAAEIPAQTLDVDAVIGAFKSAGNRMNILVLDACRDNPYAGSASGKGLAPLDAPPGTFLAYATAPGNVAEDGDVLAGNGLYTGYLLRELERPIARIEDVFKRVRLQVRQYSKGRQIPWESTSLEEDFFFNDGSRQASRPEDLERLAAEARATEQVLLQRAAQARERQREIAAALEKERQAQAEAAATAERQRVADFERAREAERLSREAREREQARLLAEARAREEDRKAREAAALERERQLAAERDREQERERRLAQEIALAKALEAERIKDLELAAAQLREDARLKRLPAREAQEQAFAAEQADWDRVKDSDNADDLYAFLRKYPSGYISEQAQFRLERLQKAQTIAVPGPDGVVPIAPAERRYEVGDTYVFQHKNRLTNKQWRATSKVISADENQAVFNNGDIWTQSGVELKNAYGTKKPGVVRAPANLAAGKRWRSAYNNLRPDKVVETNFMDLHAVEYVTLTVPAGTFKTLLVEGRGEAWFTRTPAGQSRLETAATFIETRSWFDVVTARRVRHEYTFRDNGSMSRISASFIEELVSFQGPSTKP